MEGSNYEDELVNSLECVSLMIEWDKVLIEVGTGEEDWKGSSDIHKITLTMFSMDFLILIIKVSTDKLVQVLSFINEGQRYFLDNLLFIFLI